jgi:hypothetical protein
MAGSRHNCRSLYVRMHATNHCIDKPSYPSREVLYGVPTTYYSKLGLVAALGCPSTSRDVCFASLAPPPGAIAGRWELAVKSSGRLGLQCGKAIPCPSATSTSTRHVVHGGETIHQHSLAGAEQRCLAVWYDMCRR